MDRNYSVTLSIPDEIYDKMDRLHISEEDVYGVVEHCEASDETVLDSDSGVLAGYLRIGIIT